MRAAWMHLAVIVTVLSLVAGCVSATPMQPATEVRPLASQPPAAQAPPTPAPPTLVPITAAPPTATSASSAAASAPPTPLPALMDVVKAYEAAVNRDDARGFPALFPEQFVYQAIWDDIAVNQKQLADVTAFLAAMHDGMRLTECWQSQENQVKCSATYWDDCYKAAGVPAITISLGFTILDNKIKLLNREVAESSRADDDKDTLFEVNAAVWMRKERAALRDKVYDNNGNPIFSSEAGAIRSSVCQEYAATLK